MSSNFSFPKDTINYQYDDEIEVIWSYDNIKIMKKYKNNIISYLHLGGAIFIDLSVSYSINTLKSELLKSNFPNRSICYQYKDDFEIMAILKLWRSINPKSIIGSLLNDLILNLKKDGDFIPFRLN